MTTAHFTAEDILADMRDRLDRARADLKRATRSGYGREGAFATAMHMLTALRERAPELADVFEERVTRTITRPATATDRLEALADY